MARILIVDDEVHILTVLERLFIDKGHEIVTATDGGKALEALGSATFDLMIADIRMVPMGGMELLETVCKQMPSMPVIMMTAYAAPGTAVDALKMGAFDYVIKPVDVDKLLFTVEKALEYHEAMTGVIDLKTNHGYGYRLGHLVAESPSMKKVCEVIERVVTTDVAVLISGELGSGKEFIARTIHELSRQADHPFRRLDCADFSEAFFRYELFGYVEGAFDEAYEDKMGLLEECDDGSLFLNSIEYIPPAIQEELLHALEENVCRRLGSTEDFLFGTRMLSATECTAEQLLEKKNFNEELYSRLSVIPVEIQPLRHRHEDVLPLVYHFIRMSLGEDDEWPSLGPDARLFLEQYSWPDNVHELEQIVSFSLEKCGKKTISAEHLPPELVNAVEMLEEAPDAHVNARKYRAQSLKEFLRSKGSGHLGRMLE